MPGPAPIYIVEYAGEQLPGYVQSEARPLELTTITNTFFGRDGADMVTLSAGVRRISMDFLVMTTLGSNSSGLDHLENIMDQYRVALGILTRTYGLNNLRIHDSDRYYRAVVENVSAPLVAGQSRKLVYTVNFSAQPWAYALTPVTGSFSGNGTVTIDGLDDSRKTYPVFTVPSGVTAFVAEDENGRLIEFTRGSFTGEITIDCASLTVVNDAGTNSINTMDTLNFGLYYTPNVDGEFEVVVTGYAGSGTVDIDVSPRYEL